LNDPAGAPVLFGALVGRRQEDTRQLEQADVLVAHVEVAARGGDETREQRRPEHGLIRGQRRRQAERVRVGVVREQRRRVDLRAARSVEIFLVESLLPLLACQSRASAAEYKRIMHLVQVEEYDLLD